MRRVKELTGQCGPLPRQHPRRQHLRRGEEPPPSKEFAERWRAPRALRAGPGADGRRGAGGRPAPRHWLEHLQNSAATTTRRREDDLGSDRTRCRARTGPRAAPSFRHIGTLALYLDRAESHNGARADLNSRSAAGGFGILVCRASLPVGVERGLKERAHDVQGTEQVGLAHYRMLSRKLRGRAPPRRTVITAANRPPRHARHERRGDLRPGARRAGGPGGPTLGHRRRRAGADGIGRRRRPPAPG